MTLFFGELLPKALAVSNSEYVARKLVPVISRLSTLLLPVTATVTFLSDLVLKNAGMRSEEDRNVSEDMLRMVVDEVRSCRVSSLPVLGPLTTSSALCRRPRARKASRRARGA